MDWGSLLSHFAYMVTGVMIGGASGIIGFRAGHRQVTRLIQDLNRELDRMLMGGPGSREEVEWDMLERKTWWL